MEPDRDREEGRRGREAGPSGGLMLELRGQRCDRVDGRRGGQGEGPGLGGTKLI